MTTTPADLARLRESDPDSVRREEYYRAEWMTDEQWACAEMLAAVYGGHHHLWKIRPFGEGIIMSCPSGRLSTFDFSDLTELVVLAHDRAIRVEVQSSAPGRVGLVVHYRGRREGRMYERHPELEEHVAEIRRAVGT